MSHFITLSAICRLGLWLPVLGLALGSAARAQSSDDGFDPNVDGNVYAMVMQPDGRVVVGGGFLHVQPNGNGTPAFLGRIARLNGDGSLDDSFGPFFNGDVTSLALQADGKIIVAGRFTNVQLDGAASPVPRNGLARLNPDGSLDNGFNPNPSGSGVAPFPLVRAIVVQADGRILIGGGFTALQPGGTGAPVVRNRIARLNADGSVDTGFDPNASNVVLALLVQADGRILVGGGFTRLQPNGAATPVDRLRLARLNADGTLDTTFDPRPDNRVTSLAMQPDGSLLVGGSFLGMQPAGAESRTETRYLVRMSSTGAIDTTFRPSPNAPVDAIQIQADGKILVGGRFVWFQPGNVGTVKYSSNLARLYPDGLVDTSFAPSANAQVTSILVQGDRRIVVGGYFTQVGGITRRRIARIQPDGSLDAAYLPGLGGKVGVLTVQSDGRVIVGGAFANLGGVTRRSLARFSAQGELDPAFDPVIEGEVKAVAVQSDGRILIGGSFNYVDNTVRTFLARLNANGTLDTAFHPNPNGAVYTIALQSDGKILIGGAFTTLDPDDDATDSDTITRYYLARLNTDGTVDTAFNPRPNSSIDSMLVQSDGKILVGGAFTGFQPNDSSTSVARASLARINADGTIDSTLNTAVNGNVRALALMSDGRIVLGGAFAALKAAAATEAVTRNSIARISAAGVIDTAFDPGLNGFVNALAVTTDGRIVAGGTFTQLQPNGSATVIPRSRFVWINGDGTIDTTRINDFDNAVYALAAQTGGAVLVGGTFNGYSTATGTRVATEEHLVRLLATGALDTTFVPSAGTGTGNYVGALALQANGRVLVGGSFASLGGTLNQNMMRLSANGTPDYGFYTKTDGVVNAVLVLTSDTAAETATSPVAWLTTDGGFREGYDREAFSAISGSVGAALVQPDGRLIIGGNFSNTSFSGGNYLTRFNADGTIDTSFRPLPNGAIYTMVLQSDGRIVIGGAFTSLQPNGASTSATRNYIARLNSDGTLDTSYDPSCSGNVFAFKLQSDGKLLVGGSFGTFQPNSATSTTARANIARLNADGTLDTAFNPTANAVVRAFAIQGDGKIVVGGDFTSIASTARNRIARLNADGTIDSAFDPFANGSVYSLAVQSNGQILAGGLFTTFRPNSATTTTERNFIARIKTDGTLDTTFIPQLNGFVDVIALQSDGRILLGGGFTQFRTSDGSDVIRRNHIARLSTDGTVDTRFNPSADGAVNEIVVHTDGSIILAGAFASVHPEATVLFGGTFTVVNNEPVNRLARLNDDGSHDAYYRPEPDGDVYALAAQQDRRVIVGGAFSTIGGVARGRVARLAVDGAVESAFNPNADGDVNAVAIQPDGRIVLGGAFTNVGGSARQRLARVSANGTLDGSFSASADARVNAVVVQADGRILVAGEFTTVNGTAHRGLARLRADGTLDASFDAGSDGPVWSIAAQTDGRIVVGGAFTRIGGAARAHVARLNTDGTLDATFTGTTDGAVYAVAVQPDGRPLLGGAFTRLNGRARYLVGRLANTGSATETLTVSADRTRLTWVLGGTAPEFSSVLLFYSADNGNWTQLGSASRTGAAGTWQLSGLSLPATSLYYLRASCVLGSTRYASSGYAQTGWQVYGTRVAGAAVSASAGSPADDPSSSDPSKGGTGSGSGDDSGSGGDTGSGSGSGTGTGGGSAGSAALHLVNLSLRAQPGSGAPLIAGFYVGGTESQQVVLRAVGPTLQAFGVDATMSRPQLRLYDGSGQLLAQNDGWGGAPDLQAAFTRAGAFPLSNSTSTDAALVATLPPGAYTIHVDDGDKPSGIGLGEIYFATDSSAGGGLANLSSRAPVGVGLSTSITGFVVAGDAPRRLLVRAAGPALGAYGVTDAVADPILAVYNSAGAMIADNDDWQEQADAAQSSTIAATMSAAGAFAFAPGSKDAAIVLELPAGAYTVHVVADAPGTALAEIYELP